MSQKSSAPPARVPAEKLVRDIRRATRKHHAAEDKIRIVLEGLRGEESIAALCRREAIAESLYYAWSKEFLEAGKRRLAGDTARAATSDEVKALRQEARALKEVVGVPVSRRPTRSPKPPPAIVNARPENISRARKRGGAYYPWRDLHKGL
jgi:transposase